MSKSIVRVNGLLAFILLMSFQYPTKKIAEVNTAIFLKDTFPSGTVKVLNIVKQNKRIASTGEDLGKQCDKWSLDKSLIEKIFKSSHQISGEKHHYLYDVWPCGMEGKILINKDTFSFEINPGSYMIIWNRNTQLYYGCTDKKFKKYFLSGEWDGKEESP